MDKLIFTITAEQSDLDFLRLRFQGAMEEIVEEYKRNLDSPVEIDWEWVDGS